MRLTPFRTTALGLAAALLLSCSGDGPTSPPPMTRPVGSVAFAVGPSVRISELHYDNVGTDANESIEISGPAGTDLTGWSVVLYNGASTSLSTYNTRALSGTIPATCDQRGVVVLAYPVDGIQNGSPDGLALVDAGGAVVEFLSYEGTFTAANGPAAGLLSTDILSTETTSTPIGSSLQRAEDGTWSAPTANSFGTCNDGTTNDGPPAEAVRVAITPESDTILVGGSVALSAAAFDATDAPIPAATITWSSDDEGVATVSASGLVTGIAAGVANIVAAAGVGVIDTATITVEAAPVSELPATRFSEIHYDNDGVDAAEAIEIEGPAGTDLTGWRVVLYNQTGGVSYSTTTLAATIPAQCDGRGVVAVNYPANGIQNGPADGFALVDAGGAVIEFLSYEGTLTATDGPAAGLLSRDIGVAEAANSPIGQSLQRDAAGAWSGPLAASIGACNGGSEPPPPPPSSISFTGRTPSDAALPVGFEDQLFATLRTGAGVVVPTTFTWTSETPLLGTVDANGVLRALGAGTVIVRATAEDGTTATYALPTRIAEPSATAQYAGNAAFGEPFDSDASDDFLVRRAQYTASYNPVKGTPNWVSYDLDASHFGGEDRCDCFTFDPELPATFARYTTADYTGAGAIAGYGIDRGHLARSFDRTAGSLDNATTFYFTNIIPQAADNNQGPWAAMENYLGDLARFQDREVYVIAGVAGNKGTVKNEGRITIPAAVWKVALVLPRDAGLASVDSWDDVEVIAAILPNEAGIRNVDWQTYRTTVDAVEALSGYDLLDLLRDDIEIAVESGTRPPTAAVDGPWAAYAGDPVALSAAASSDFDGDALTFTWEFGDGTTATGQDVSHIFTGAASYTVRLIATDIRGLADTVEANAGITPLPSVIGIARAKAGVQSLVTSGRLTKGLGTALTLKLDGALKWLDRGPSWLAKLTLQAVVWDLDVLVRARRLTTEEAAPIREVLVRVLGNL